MPLDGLVAQLLNFSERVGAEMDDLPSGTRDAQEPDEDELAIAHHRGRRQRQRVLLSGISPRSRKPLSVPLRIPPRPATAA